jgi:hypothetical protein
MARGREDGGACGARKGMVRGREEGGRALQHVWVYGTATPYLTVWAGGGNGVPQRVSLLMCYRCTYR